MKIQHLVFKHKAKVVESAFLTQQHGIFSEKANSEAKLITTDAKYNDEYLNGMVTPANQEISHRLKGSSRGHKGKSGNTSMRKKTHKSEVGSQSGYKTRKPQKPLSDNRIGTLQTPILKSAKKPKGTKAMLKAHNLSVQRDVEGDDVNENGHNKRSLSKSVEGKRIFWIALLITIYLENKDDGKTYKPVRQHKHRYNQHAAQRPEYTKFTKRVTQGYKTVRRSQERV